MMRFLQSDPLQHACIIEPLRLGRANLLQSVPDGVLVHDPEAKLHLLAAKNIQTAEQLLDGVKNPHFFMLCDAAHAPLLHRFHFHHGMRCLQAVYCKKEPPALDSRLRIGPPDDRQMALIIQNYTMDAPEELHRRRKKGELFFATDQNGCNVGFVGLHPEGCFGILQVLPEMRGRGYGAALESYIIRFCMDTGRLPYCQVDVNNHASLCLQKKLELEFCSKPLLMAWNDT